jgi:type I restriction enzyme, R subunit
MDGHGNAMLVAGSIYEACKFYELFAKTELAGQVRHRHQLRPVIADTKGETTGEGETDNLLQVRGVSPRCWPTGSARGRRRRPSTRSSSSRRQVKKKFIDEPGQMKLLIVVDKLLTGFDAPSATYLYIDKQMRDHGLFQAICRVNRLDGDDKEYGYIIDYKDLFKSLEGAVADYTSGALDGYDKEDVKGLLEDRLEKAREIWKRPARPSRPCASRWSRPRDEPAYLHYFCAKESGNAEQLKDNEPKRLKLYKFTAALMRAYANWPANWPKRATARRRSKDQGRGGPLQPRRATR